MLEIYLIGLGFKEEEIETIQGHFSCSLNLEDWESISFEEDDEEVEGFDNFLKLPTGRVVYFPDELMRKDLLAQID
jgi:hypothetical protein